MYEIAALFIATLQFGWDVFSSLPETDQDPLVTVRVHGGYGIPDGSKFSDDANISNAGIRIFRNNGSQRYGFEVNRFYVNDPEISLSENDSFDAYGLVLEQKLGSGLIASFGVMGYSGYDNSHSTPVGTMFNLGWEPKFGRNSQFQPYIAYRNDAICGEDTDMIQSLSIGFTWNSSPL